LGFGIVSSVRIRFSAKTGITGMPGNLTGGHACSGDGASAEFQENASLPGIPT
jgi:hypothetical protein